MNLYERFLKSCSPLPYSTWITMHDKCPQCADTDDGKPSASCPTCNGAGFVRVPEGTPMAHEPLVRARDLLKQKKAKQ